MAIARIKELLKRFNPQASDADIEELAKALDSSGAQPRVGAAVSEEELAQRKKFLESIGETNRARQEELEYIESEIAKTRAAVEAQIDLVAATKDLTQAQEDQNEQTNENADAQQNQNEQTAEATKKSEELKEKLKGLRLQKIALKLEMRETASGFDFLTGVIGNASKEFSGLGEAVATSQGAFKGISDTVKTLQAGGGGLSLLDNLVSNQGIQRLMAQSDILNVLASDMQRAFEVASHLDEANARLYKTMGGGVVNTRRFSFQLANLANESESLLMKGPELENAAIALQEAYRGFTGGEEDFQMIKQLALLEKAGIQARDAAEIFSFYKQGNDDMAAQAETVNLRLIATANALKRPPSEIAAAFKQGLKSIGAYGKNFQGTMTKMVTIAQKLNMEISDLTGTFDNLDTIEGAAKVAGDINNLLGKSVLNPVALAKLDLPDKIIEIQKAISEFDLKGPTGRFMVKQLAESLGIGADSIIRLQGLTGNALETAANEIATTGKLTVDQLKDIENNIDRRNAEAMQVNEKAAKNLERQFKIDPGTAQDMRESAGGLMSSAGFRNAAGILSAAVSIGAPFLLKRFGAKGAVGAGVASAAAAEAGLGGVDDSEVSGPVQKVFVSNFSDDAIQALKSIAPTAGIAGTGGLGGIGGTIPVTDDMIVGEDGAGGAGGMGGFGPNKLGKNLATGAAVASSLGGLKDLGDFVGLTGEAGRKEDLGGAIGTALLGGIGAVFGGPVGFAIGAQIGNTIGGGIGGYFDRNSAATKNNNQAAANSLLNPVKNEDFTVADFRKRANADPSDEIVGVKEGGLLAKKLDKLISIMSGQGGTSGDVVIQLDGREVGRAAVKSINNDFYNMRD